MNAITRAKPRKPYPSRRWREWVLALSITTAVVVAFTVALDQTRTPARAGKANAPRVATYQGETFRWWVSRARANGAAARWQAKRADRLRRILAARVTVSGDLAQGFLCIHGFEGPWNDPSGPYYGGLQMDRSFMLAYGAEFYRAWGTADHWPPFVQIAVAMRGHLSGRGWSPWPKTRRYCGL